MKRATSPRSIEETTRTEAAFWHAPVAMATLATDGRWLQANLLACELLGYGGRELLELAWADIAYREDGDSGLALMRQALDDGVTICSLTLRLLQKDGSIVVTHVLVSPVRNVVGEPDCFVLAFTIPEAATAASVRSEAAIALSEARLKEAQRVARVGSWELDLASGELTWSDQIFRIFEIDPKLFAPDYRRFLDAVHPEDRPLVDEAYRNSLITRQGYEIAHRLVMPDGRLKWVNECCQTFYDEHGTALRSVGTTQDITAAKLMSDELARHRENLEEVVKERTFLLDQAQQIGKMGHWEWIIASDRLSWSDQVFRIFGYQPGAFTPTYARFMERVHPDDLGLIKQSELDAIGTHAPHSVDHRIVWPNGELRWVHEEAIVAFDAAGRATGLTGTVQDITERKSIENALQVAKSFATATIDAVNQNICVLDKHGRIMMVNQAWREFYTANDVQYSHLDGTGGSTSRNYGVGANYLEICDTVRGRDAESAAAVARGIRAVISGEQRQFSFEYPCHSPDRQRWFNAQVTRFRGDSGNVVVAHEDITQRLLAQQELIATREAAEAANLAKSSFLSSMSHELRTPLNAILGYAQLLALNEAASPDLMQSGAEIEKAGRHLLALINDILDLSRIEAGRVTLHLETVDFAEILAECLPFLEGHAQSRRISLHLPQESAVLLADRMRLRQVLLNLLSNAVKYNVVGGRVSVLGVHQPERRYRILVTDTGSGIAAERLGDVFQPFNRIGAERRNIEGTGIGLSITRSLVELMSGQIGVESSEGVGSTFWIELPLA